MSLKGVHMIFITCAILLAVGFGFWSMQQYAQQKTVNDMLTGSASFATSVLLAMYGVNFWKKLKT